MSTRRLSFIFAISLVIFLIVLSTGCTSTTPASQTTTTTTVNPTVIPTVNVTANATVIPTATATPVVHSSKTLIIATTTSLYDTGLLNHIQDVYTNETGVKLMITSQGTGQAIQLAQRGDADLLLVHSPSQEQTFISNGYGTNARCFAYNYFMIVGPANDPAGIANLAPKDAFAKIRAAGMNGTANVSFVSRGDGSGTHTAEQGLWKKAGFNYTTDISNSGPWYVSIGKGMGDTLVFAGQKNAYTLTDEGTFLAYKSKLQLTPLVTKGNDLLNRYSAIAVNPAKNPNVNEAQADRFINWLMSDEGKQVVGSYGVDTYGKSLFTSLTPDVSSAAQFNCTSSGFVSPV
jgi:tungstate transport system substrate-binding protein